MVIHAAPIASLQIRDSGRLSQCGLYDRALDKARRGQLWSCLTRRSRALLSLEEVSRVCTVQDRSGCEQRTVALAQICGSESRAADFDCDFNPLQSRTRDRWLGIAAALQQGRYLPPVALVQVADRYFVRDGHHRISVARSLGQRSIEATVEVWRTDGPLPWQETQQAPNRRRTRGRARAGHLVDGSGPASILGRISSLLRPADRAGASQIA